MWYGWGGDSRSISPVKQFFPAYEAFPGADCKLGRFMILVRMQLEQEPPVPLGFSHKNVKLFLREPLAYRFTAQQLTNQEGEFMTTIFSKIVQGEIPADIVYQDDQVTAFKDIQPQAPVHILIIPNKEIPTVNDLTADDEQLIGRLFTVAAKIARDQGVAQDGYRLLVNCNRHGGQEVFHLHMHLFGGRPLGPMLMRS
jgi:histidine triad (HIT) family protein